MPGNKYLQLGTPGFSQEVAAAQTSAGVGDANKIVALDANGKLDPTLMPAGLGADSIATTAGEALTAGNLVYLDGTGVAMKADANAVGKRAIGFVLASVALNAAVTVYFEGSVTGLTGLTPGADYFLSAAATGAIVLAAGIPTVAGSIVQHIGFALNATTVSFEAGEPIIRA